MKNFDFEKAYKIFKQEKLLGHENKTLEDFKNTAERMLELFDDDTRVIKTGYFELEVTGELQDEIEFKFVPFYCLVVR